MSSGRRHQQLVPKLNTGGNFSKTSSRQRPDNEVGNGLQDLAEEELGALVLGVGEEVFGGAHFHDLAAVHEDDAVGDLTGEAHLVGDDEHGHAAYGQLLHHVEHLFDHLGVEGGGGLVEEHDFGLHGERAGDGDALLLAAGELAGVLVGLFGDADAVEQAHGRLLRLLLLHLAHVDRREGDVLDHGQMGEEVELLEDHAGFGADLLDVAHVAGQWDAVDDDFAGLVLFKTVDAADKGGFAGAGPAR